MGQIKLLSSEVVSMIAAGEVVERPVSVAKELLDNAIDSGASHIVLEVKGSGQKLIKVVDNGKGIDQKDAELVLTQHATSKLQQLNDLYSLNTMGFRGEALASIASVSNFKLTTSHPTGQTSIISEFGAAAKIKHSEANNLTGTTVEVSDIFDNVPARKKFLKSSATELKQIQTCFEQLALSFPQIHWEFKNEQKTIYNLPATNILSDRVRDMFGKEVSSNLFEVSLPGEPSIHGFVGNSHLGRHDSKLQFTFVNHRPVSDKLVQAAVKQAYQGFLHRDLKPVFILFIDINPSEVDINVHPRKLEVKFAQESAIFTQVLRSVKTALESGSRNLLQERINNSKLPFGEIKTEKAEFTSRTNDSSSLETDKVISNIRPNQSSQNAFRPQAASTKKQVNQALSFTEQILNTKPSGALTVSSIDLKPWQLWQTYVVYELGNKVIWIDQHAAAEKILYEKLLTSYGQQKIQSKPKLIPEIVELSAADYQKLQEYLPLMQKLGFAISPFGPNSYQISELPELLSPNMSSTKLIQELLEHENPDQLDQLDLIKPIIASMACHGSIRAGQKLMVAEMNQLIQNLGKCQDPFNCPHGRPTSWEMTKDEVARKFNRIT